MTTTAAHHQHDGAGSGKAPRRIRLLGAALALVATSAGLGAAVQREFTSAPEAPGVTVVQAPDAVRGDIDLAHGASGCIRLASNTRVVTVASRYPSAACRSRSALVSDRVTESA